MPENPLLNSKLPDVGTSIFAVMSRMAADHDALNLSQGFPDFNCPEALIDRVDAHMRAGHNQYAPMPGVPRLRQAIADKTRFLYQADVDPETEITVTCGATEALFAAITASIRPGDEVIVFDPAYDAYEPAIELAGGQAVHLNLVAPDYHVDWDQVSDAITGNTRMIITNSPHNPTGAVFTDADLDALEQIVSEHPELLLIGDEVYEHIVFDDHSHCSLLQRSALRSRAFVMSSFGKTWHTTGWKIGYCVAPPELTTELRKVHQFTSFAISTPMQHAFADVLEDRDHYLDLPDFYQHKRDRFREEVASSSFVALPCDGTYFQLLDYSAISDKPDTEFAAELTRDVGIASIPVSVFYADPPADQRVLRFCFAKGDQTLSEAGEILRSV